MYKGPQRKFKPRKTRRQKRQSEYSVQLLEKQKMRKAYGLREKALKNYFNKASRSRVNIDHALEALLEKRLDNVVYRLGWSETRAQAAQFINHGHIVVNNRKVTIPSFEVGKDDTIEVKTNKKDKGPFKHLSAKLEKYKTPGWLSYATKDKTKAKVNEEPRHEYFTEPINIALVLQFYSR